MDSIQFHDNLGNIAIGLYDIPYSPQATVLYLNPLKNNAVIFGGALSGKTTIVKNVLARMNEEQPYISWENTYVLDFGGNVGRYSELGRICACFDNSNEENVKRIFRTVEQRFGENSRRLNGENYFAYQEAHPDKPLPHITLIIENVTAFLGEDRYSPYHDVFYKLVRDGLSKGVSVLLTAADLTGGLNRVMVYFTRRLALEVQKDKYMEIFNTRVDEPMRVPGRGVTIVDGTPREFQAFLPFDNADGLEKLIASSAAYGVEKMRSFPPDLMPEDVRSFCPDTELPDHRVLVGLDYYFHTPVSVDLTEVHNLALYGKNQADRLNVLRAVVRGALRACPGANFLFFDDAREQLRELYGEIREKCTGTVDYSSRFDTFKSWVNDVDDGKFTRGAEPTFMIVQNKTLYSRKRRSSGVTLDGFYLTYYMTRSEEKNYYFIFSDVPKIADKSAYDEMNSLLNAAFLMDSIGDFLNEKGGSSVFNGMDAREMKREFAPCEDGDGYYYDVSREDLRKFKMIKSE